MSFGGLHDTSDWPASLCGRGLVCPTSSFQFSKDSPGLKFSGLRPFFRGLGDTIFGVRFLVTTFWFGPAWQYPWRTPRESVRRGFLSLGTDW